MLVDVKCPHCGATMQFDDSQASMFCPYCGGKLTIANNNGQNQTASPNLFISYSTNNSAVGMVTRIVSTGVKNTYVNGQTLSFHLEPGNHTIVLKIGRINYNRNIVIPPDNTPVKIYASFNGKAQITIDQPPIPVTHVETPAGSQTQTNSAQRVNQTSVNDSLSGAMNDVASGFKEAFNGVSSAFTGNAPTPSGQTNPVGATNTQQSSTSFSKIFWVIPIIVVFSALSIILISTGLKTSGGLSGADKSSDYKLYLDISSETNIFFNTYDITISLDGKELGSVSNGKNFTYLAEVRKGSHELTFCQTGNTFPKATKRITVSNDMTYTCNLSHDAFSIGVKSENYSDNIDGSSLEVIDVTGIPLDEAKDKLKEAGFVNVREEPYGDIWERGNWIVSTQNVAPGTHVDKNEYIQLDCVKGESYFDPIFEGKNIIECQAIAEGEWYILTFKKDTFNSLDVSTMTYKEKSEWVVTSASYGRAYKEVYLTVENTSKHIATPTPTPDPNPKDTPTPTPRLTETSAEVEKEYDSLSEYADVLEDVIDYNLSTNGSNATYAISVDEEKGIITIGFVQPGASVVKAAAENGDRDMRNTWKEFEKSFGYMASNLYSSVINNVDVDDPTVVVVLLDENDSESVLLWYANGEKLV